MEFRIFKDNGTPVIEIRPFSKIKYSDSIRGNQISSKWRKYGWVMDGFNDSPLELSEIPEARQAMRDAIEYDPWLPYLIIPTLPKLEMYSGGLGMVFLSAYSATIMKEENKNSPFVQIIDKHELVKAADNMIEIAKKNNLPEPLVASWHGLVIQALVSGKTF